MTTSYVFSTGAKAIAHLNTLSRRIARRDLIGFICSIFINIHQPMPCLIPPTHGSPMPSIVRSGYFFPFPRVIVPFPSIRGLSPSKTMVHQLRPYCGLRFANTRVMIFRNVLLGTYVVTILAGGELQAQGSTLYTDGILRVKGADWQDSRLTVMPQFGDAFEIPLTSDHFKLDLGLLSTYLIRAAHEGCATKEIVFDLWVPDAYRNATFRFPFEIILEAFKANEEPYSYEQPIGAVFFDEATADFTYITDY